MAPRVVACDLDGTLLRSDGTLDERTRHALAEVECVGAMLILCTARPVRWVIPLAALTGHRGIAICANGAVVVDLHTEAVLDEWPLEPALAGRIVNLLRAALPGGAWAVERSNGFGHEPTYTPIWPTPPGTIVDAVDALISEPAVKLMLRHNGLSADDLLRRARELVGELAELSHSSSADVLLEISAAGVSKGAGLSRLCEQRGIAREDVIAFGDMPNDLPMLRWAGHAVAVANAHRDVLASVDEVTASNDEAGVAQVLERVFGFPPRT